MESCFCMSHCIIKIFYWSNYGWWCQSNFPCLIFHKSTFSANYCMIFGTPCKTRICYPLLKTLGKWSVTCTAVFVSLCNVLFLQEPSTKCVCPVLGMMQYLLHYSSKPSTAIRYFITIFMLDVSGELQCLVAPVQTFSNSFNHSSFEWEGDCCEVVFDCHSVETRIN